MKLDGSNMNDLYYASGDYAQDMLCKMKDDIKRNRTDLETVKVV